MALLSAYSDLIPLIQPEVPGADTPILRYAIRRAARRFCEDTEVWQENIDLTIVADQTSYELIADDEDDEVRRIMQVRCYAADDDLNNPSLGYDLDINCYALEREAGASNLILTEAVVDNLVEDDILRVVVVRVPDPLAETLPEELLSRYLTPIRLCTLRELFSMANKPWSNPGLSQMYGLDYDDHVVRARVDGVRENKFVDIKFSNGSSFLL